MFQLAKTLLRHRANNARKTIERPEHRDYKRIEWALGMNGGQILVTN